MTNGPALCPSSPCQEGAILLGIVLRDGRIAFAADQLVVDADFVHVAAQGRAPEKRFRFASPCLRGGCEQWTGGRCSVIDSVLTDVAPSAGSELPACSIRARCRWFSQAGADACRVCPAVITDLRADAGQDPAERLAPPGNKRAPST